MADVDSPCSPGKEGEVIALLLEEYRSLRNEITQSLGRAQLASFVSVIVALVTFGSGVDLGEPKIYIAVVVLLFVFLWWREGTQGIEELSLHLKSLEIRINKLAASAYGTSDAALTWETMCIQRRARERRLRRWFRRIGGWSYPG